MQVFVSLDHWVNLKLIQIHFSKIIFLKKHIQMNYCSFQSKKKGAKIIYASETELLIRHPSASLLIQHSISQLTVRTLLCIEYCG